MVYFKKKLLVVLLLSSFIIFFVSSSVNASTTYNYTTDNVSALKQYQENLANIFIYAMEQSKNASYKTQFLQDLESNFAVFYVGSVNNQVRIYCNLYPKIGNFYSLNEVENAVTVFFDDYFDIPISGYNLSPSDLGVQNIKRYGINPFDYWVFTSDISSSGSIFLPTILVGYNNPVLVNYMNGIGPNESGFSMLWTAIQDNTEQEEETTNELQKLNSFMSSEDVDQDAYDMPTQNGTTDATGQRT